MRNDEDSIRMYFGMYIQARRVTLYYMPLYIVIVYPKTRRVTVLESSLMYRVVSDVGAFTIKKDS